MRKIRIADFSAYPAGRSDATGPYNGSKFREEILLRELRKAEADGQKLIVVFDGLKSVGSSFLEEAFGGLVANNSYSASQLKKLMIFEAESPSLQRYIRAVERYISKARPK
ncbi:STAS-like domain-containing protein [Paracoccus sp. Arc7-R13]|uniref:STAS-like domain-containing protein n=1 Tax=Paracoccus sp. Arc7-R13 TaxID=2500532 RepID=UPI0013E36985|nr:STAS-like domain-containing protein [Paracoccus sp. Arc7-R13]